MQFVLLIFQGTAPLPNTEAWEALPEDVRKGVFASYAAIDETPGVTPGLPLGLPGNATTVRVQDDQTLRMDGPFADNKEAVGGYVVVEADDLDAAIELAALIPAARLGGTIEIRPVGKYW
jgi:hypothetical protein